MEIRNDQKPVDEAFTASRALSEREEVLGTDPALENSLPDTETTPTGEALERYGKIEIDGELIGIEKVNKIIEKALSDLYEEGIDEEAFLAKYGLTRNESEDIIRNLLIARERDIIVQEFILIHPEIKIINEEHGVYAIDLDGGGRLYGSIYSILDTDESLGRMAEVAREIQSDLVDSSLSSVMALKTHEGDGFRSIIVASGSFAQGEIHEHPSDLDFGEHLEIHADSMELAGQKLAALIQETIEDASDNPKVEFRELKCGIYPEGFPEEIISSSGETLRIRGKSIKWTGEDVRRGEKILVGHDGVEYRISLSVACEDPRMVKIDWLTTITGELKELTKVVNLRVINPRGEIIGDNRLEHSAFQEIYFSDVSDFHLTELLREPRVMKEYLDFLKSDIKKYSDPDHSNFLKVAKRAYKLAEVRGDIQGARSIAEVFLSGAAELGAKAESLDLIDDYAEKPGKFELSSFVGQIESLATFILNDNELFTEGERNYFVDELNSLIEHLLSEKPSVVDITTIIRSITPQLKEKISQKVKEFLDNNSTYKALIQLESDIQVQNA